MNASKTIRLYFIFLLFFDVDFPESYNVDKTPDSGTLVIESFL